MNDFRVWADWITGLHVTDRRCTDHVLELQERTNYSCGLVTNVHVTNCRCKDGCEHTAARI